MKSLTEVLLGKGNTFDIGLQEGAHPGTDGRRELLTLPKRRWAEVRAAYGLTGAPIILTEPRGNNKLKKAEVPSYGLTLQHYVQRFRSIKMTVNACPHAGDCTKVCVLDNGYGMMPGIQEARRARTEFLARYPYEAGVLIGREIQRAVETHGFILFRPNVNSDVEWEKVAPSLTGGAIWGKAVLSYGYTKLPYVLDTDGWLDKYYRVAYSWNENSDPDAVEEFITCGGSVAVVTARRKGAPLTSIQLGKWEYHNDDPDDTPWIVDADKTDEWIFEPGTIGDLSAKGRARRLIGKSGFVVTTGGS